MNHIQYSKRFKPFFPYMVMLGIAALAFYQVVFGLNPMVYDMIDCYYPWRFHIGECLQNGIFPYWNPYQDLGYPIHADPSSGVWYPMVWLLGSTVGYSSYTIGLEFFFHVFFAGAGMFTLVKTLKMNPQVALIAAISYMLCGIFVGNAQHLTYIVSAAWLPFLLSFYFKMIQEPSWRNAVFSGFFLFLMMTGGYPAFVIILFYFFLIAACIYIWKTAKANGRKACYLLIARHAVFVLTALVLSSGILISVWQVSPYLSRLEGFSLEQVLYSPFGPRAFLSFLAPYAAVKFPEFFNGDISMINGYFGIALFLFFAFGLFSKKSFELKLLFGFAIFSLAAAVGDALPIRELLYKYVPMMSVFRFPSVFRLFVILPFIVIAANYLNQWFERQERLPVKKWSVVILIAVSLFGGLVLFLRSKTHLGLVSFFKSVVLNNSPDSFLEQHIAFQSIIQIVILLAVLAVVWLIKIPRVQLQLITGIVIIDLLIATQLNAPYTVFYPQITAEQAHDAVSKYPQGFPELEKVTIAESVKMPSPGTPYWQNYHCFLKQITAEGFNSFSFGSYENLESQFPFIYNELQNNSVLLLTDKVEHANKMTEGNRDSSYTRDILYFGSESYTGLNEMALKHDSSDIAQFHAHTANHFEVKTEVREKQLLTIFQKYYHGWEARIDGKKTTIHKSNLNFMSIVVPKGKHDVEFIYRNNAVRIAFAISLTVVLLIGIYALLTFLRPLTLKSRSIS